MQHLTGRAAFRHIELEVGPGVFVPRPETELLVEIALGEIEQLQQLDDRANETLFLADCCTGSGAVALALAREIPETIDTHISAVEQSPEAFAWATRNVARLGDGRVTLQLGDFTEIARAPAFPTEGVDLLVSNPPYVPTGMVPIDPEVRDHDPELALYAGSDGLDVIRRIAIEAQGLVRPRGLVAIEHAETQGSAVRSLLDRAGWSEASTHLDLTGRERVTSARR